MSATVCSSSSSCSSDSRMSTSSIIHQGRGTCNFCEKRLTLQHYVVDSYQTFCNAGCHHKQMTKEAEENRQERRKLTIKSRELEEEQEELKVAMDALTVDNNSLAKKNKEFESEIRIRNEEIDKFTLLDFDN